MIKDLYLGIIVLSHYAAGLEQSSCLRFPSVGLTGMSCRKNFSLSIKVADRIRAQLLSLHHEFFRERSSDGV